MVLVGLLKFIKGRWACLPLAHKFYLPQNAINSKQDNMNISGETPSFRTKLEQAADMLAQLAHHFDGVKILCICDSWFGNNGLFKPARKHIGNLFNLLSRLRSNTVLYSTMLPEKLPGQSGRPRKYGNQLGSCAEMAATFKAQASKLRVFLYTDGATKAFVRLDDHIFPVARRSPLLCRHHDRNFVSTMAKKLLNLRQRAFLTLLYIENDKFIKYTNFNKKG